MHFLPLLPTKTNCSEDLLKNQIKALEAQLQVSLQKFPTDRVKKLVVQMEKQKVVYEEKALAAIQRATQEKMEALSKTEILQEALQTVKADVSRWQGLYEELIEINNQLKKSEELSTGHVQQLQSQLELSKGRETWLREEMELQQCEGEELHSRITHIIEENQALREEIHSLRENRAEIQDPTFLLCEPSESPEKEHTGYWGEVEEQFRHTKNKLQLKERECEMLQTELEATEQEFQSSQGRLAQCRDELAKQSHRQTSNNPSRRPCGSWWVVYMFLVLILVVVGAAMWLWHPPFRD
ncbi:TRAF3-interacting JNK-activating modulator, partial [Aplochiton taeniatus]